MTEYTLAPQPGVDQAGGGGRHGPWGGGAGERRCRGVCCTDVRELWPVFDFSKRIQRGEKAQDGMLANIVLGTDRGSQVQGD